MAILYFKNLSGTKDLDHFSYSLPELLTTDLGQSKYIKVLSEDKVSKILKESNYLSSAFIDEKMFERLGDSANVNYLVQGSFIKSGNDLRITVKLRDSDTGEMLSTDYVDATSDNIFPAIDRLTTGLKRRFNMTDQEILADIDNDIESITTSSPDALKYYISGKKLFNSNNYNASIIEFKKAVGIDPDFAMAYRGIAYSYTYLNDLHNRDKYFKLTFAHIKKMSEREQLLIYGDYYGEDFTTFRKSLDSYNKLLKIYPDDINANLESGFFYMWFEQWNEAIKRLQNVLENECDNIFAVKYMGSSYLGKGDLEKAEKLITNFEKVYPLKNRSEILEFKYRLYMIKKEYGKALRSVEEEHINGFIDDNVYLYLRSKIKLLRDGVISSQKVFEEIRNNNIGVFDHAEINDIEFMFLHNGLIESALSSIDDEIKSLDYRGYIKDALCTKFLIMLRNGSREDSQSILEQFKTNSNLNYTTAMIYRNLFLKGLANINIGNLTTSKINTEEIKKIMGTTLFQKEVSRLYFLLRGLIDKAEGHYPNAIINLIEASRVISCERGMSDEFNAISAYIFYELGYVNFLSNNMTESEKWFMKLGNLSLERYYFGDLYVKSLYYLGNIYEKTGQDKKAGKMYSRFIQLWEKGDESIVKDLILNAKKRQEFMQNHTD